MTVALQISIDGPTAAGKTTLGAGLARHFDAVFLDTGLTYRALAYLLWRGDLAGDDSWKSTLYHVPLSQHYSEKILYRGNDISDELWGLEVDNRIGLISRDPARRSQILSYHNQIVGQHPRIIAAGRDVATTLLTTAILHVFLTADFAIRRDRRRVQHSQNPARSIAVGAITERDLQTLEECRTLPNSMILDTTHMPKRVILNNTICRINNMLAPRDETRGDHDVL